MQKKVFQAKTIDVVQFFVSKRSHAPAMIVALADSVAITRGIHFYAAVRSLSPMPLCTGRIPEAASGQHWFEVHPVSVARRFQLRNCWPREVHVNARELAQCQFVFAAGANATPSVRRVTLRSVSNLEPLLCSSTERVRYPRRNSPRSQWLSRVTGRVSLPTRKSKSAPWSA